MLSEPVDPAFREGCEDDDSLFGSPPPSPSARGRSPSPTVASSSASPGVSQGLSFGSSAQNVGTIALPGSHTHSEPSINPLAASLSLPGGSCVPVLPQPLPLSEPHSHQSSVGRHETTPKPTSGSLSRPDLSMTRRHSAPSHKRNLKRKVKEQTPRPPPPSIPLPDPSQPPPAHFLRSQQALLGHAGLVARVKPFQLSVVGAPRDGSPSNPIVVDDREMESTEPPLIGRTHRDRIKIVNQSELPKPTNQEVVEMLIKQKDIFPVLQGILKLLTAGALGGKPVAPSPIATNKYPMGRARDNRLFQPPPKRRKLNRVPAGAADWDVPYPFREGEGPEAYQQTWLQDRGRQLVSQLINLVNGAAQKVAARKHLGDLAKGQKTSESKKRIDGGVDGDKNSQMSGGKGANHYRNVNESQGPPVTTSVDTPGQEGEGISSTVEQVDSVSASGTDPVEPRLTRDMNSTCSATSFNDLVSALLAVPNPNSSSSINSSYSSSEPSGPSQSSSSAESSTASTSDDQCLIDSWMNILQTFPLQEANTSTQGVSGSDQYSLDALLGLNSNGTSCSLTSPPSGNSSSFSTTPTQTFGSLDLDPVGDLDLALNLLGGVSESCGSGSSAPSSATPLADGSFSFPSPSQESAQELDRNSLNQTLSAAGGQMSSVSGSFADSPIDPHLLAMSRPDFGLIFSSSNTAQGILGRSKDGVSPSSSFASSLSPCEPVTPSSAGWDMVPEVAIDDTLDLGGTKQIQKDPQQVCAKGVVKHPIDNDRGKTSTEPDPRVTICENPTTSQPNAPASSNTSVSSAPPQSPGVFQVLRVTDLEPPTKSVPKLKKSDVLKRAEEKREELRAKVEQVKLNLWEAMIEHGALVHLMRFCSDPNQAETASPNP